jgi:hypothetical protein
MSPYFLRPVIGLLIMVLWIGSANADPIFDDRFEFPVKIPALSVHQSVFNYATDSPLLFSSQLSDGSTLSLIGTKSPDGLLGSVTTLRLVSDGNSITSVEARFDDLGRPTRIDSLFGTTTFAYDDVNVTATTTNAAGETETFVVPLPQQTTTSAFPARSKTATCDVSSLFNQQLSQGEIAFACDNAYVEDTTELAPNSLRMSVQASGFDGMWEVESPKLQLISTLGSNRPEISQHGYQYTLNTITHTNPSYDDWKPCCDLNAEAAANELAKQGNFLTDIIEGIGTLQDIANYAECGFELVSTGGTVAPTCVVLVQSYFVGLWTDAVITDLTSSGDTAAACNIDEYNDSMAFYNPENTIYSDVQVVFEKTGVRGGKATYTKASVPMTVDANGDLPTLTIGPVPADFEAGIDRIKAYRADGAVIGQSNGELDPSASIAEGEVLDFRAFDQFFDRSDTTGPFSPANREKNQHYACGEYSWTLTRNGSPYQTYSHGENNDRFRTLPLEEGDYELTLRIDSTSRIPGDFQVQYEENGRSTSTISPAETTLTFSVCDDDCKIRKHMIGTWDVVNDAAYRSDGPYADNDNSACNYLQAQDVYFENYFYPKGITVNVYAATPEHKTAKVTLNGDGSAVWRFYNIDTDNWNPGERFCPVILDPPERWDSNVTWSVNSGVIRIGGLRGHLTMERLKDSYGLEDWDFATGTQDITDRWRLWRVTE